MQPYQEEYIANLKDIATLMAHNSPHGYSYETYLENSNRDKLHITEKTQRNVDLLRDGLFPILDHLFEATDEEVKELEDFSNALIGGKNDLDSGLFCQIRRAPLSRARQKKDRNAIIRHLYWLGMGIHKTCDKMSGLNLADSEKYLFQMRLCFAEAAAYLKYYDSIDDTETRGYILRSRANTSLGHFKSTSAKIQTVRQTLQILQDQGYRKLSPDLPWDRYVYMTHRQMTSSISYSRDNDMTAEDIALLMESAHIVHETQIQEALEKTKKLLYDQLFPVTP